MPPAERHIEVGSNLYPASCLQTGKAPEGQALKILRVLKSHPEKPGYFEEPTVAGSSGPFRTQPERHSMITRDI